MTVGLKLPGIANEVYSILVEECEAQEHWRENFIQVHTDHCTEYRFQGALGFGGKFYSDHDWRVGMYRENETPERLAMAKRATQRIKEVKALCDVLNRHGTVDEVRDASARIIESRHAKPESPDAQ